jgi:hypothetical protein
MAGGAQEDRERRIPGVDGRLQEVETGSEAAARSLISSATVERRTGRREELERELHRLRQERRRFEREQNVARSIFAGQDVDRHLSDLERQLRVVIADRRRWTSDLAKNHRDPEEELLELTRLKSETDRLTAELVRCAYMLSAGESNKNPRLRRIWHMLRLSGT